MTTIEIYELKDRAARLERDNAALRMLVEALGFRAIPMNGGEIGFVHKKAKPCHCGGRVRIVPSFYEEGRWLTQCPKCAARTVTVKDPLTAVKAWNEDRWTEATRLTHEPLELCDIGAMNLTEALKRDAVRALMDAEEHGGLDSVQAEQAIWFINNKQVVDDIVSGNRRRREEEAARLAKEEAEKGKKHHAEDIH